MRKNLLVLFVLFSGIAAKAQSGFVFSCTRDTVISCTDSCITLHGYIPNIHSLADDYDVSSSSAGGFCTVAVPSSTVQGTPTNITLDDRYTQVIPLPFDFPFYGIYYSQLVASSNGYVSFDDTKAGTFSHYGILSNGFGLTAGAGTPEDLPSALYDRALIMGPYHDIDISRPNSVNRKIYYQVDGVAPYRRWILAFFEIPLFLGSCNSLYKNTHQIILNESTGIIDVFIYDKQICTGWNEGRAMVGLQNYDRDNGIMAPGRAASSAPWGSIGMNEAWRFTPKNGPTLFQRVELWDTSGHLISTGDTTSYDNSVFSVTFPNVCPATSGTYVIKSAYLKADDPSVEVYGYDTVNIIKSAAVPAVTLDTTKATCTANGSIKVTAPLGANYEYSIDNGAHWQSGNVFSVPAGHYTVLAREVGGTCTNSEDADITSTSAPVASAVPTNTSCPGVSNGSVIVHVTQGIPGFTFLIDTMTVGQTDSLFTGLDSGVHVITVKDNAGCTVVFNVTVGANTTFTTTASSTNASCLGVSNGSITVIQPSSGTAPFEYSIPGVINTPQLSTTLTGLAGGNSYTVKVKDANGCSYSFSQQVNNSPGVSATDSTIVGECAVAATGKIFIKVSTGVAPFTYSKDSGVTFQAADSFLSLLPGVYHIRVKDNVGCYYDFNSTVGVGTGVTATDSTVVSECAVASTGKVFIKRGLGTAPFSFSKDSGVTYQLTDSFLNLLPGVYHIRVKDAVGCFYDFNSTVGVGTGVTATDSTVVSECSTASTGKIFIKKGLGTAPFTYSKDSGVTFQAADSFLNLLPGVYHIRVKDAVGCFYDFNSTVATGTGVTAADSTVASECATATTGKIFIKKGLGTAPFTYSKDSGVTFQPADSFLNLLPGIYHIRVKDAVGCYYDFNSTVAIGTGVTATDSTIATACNGVSTGRIFIKTGLGTAPFTFSKDSGLTYQAADSFLTLAKATYPVRVKDAVGCFYDFHVAVTAGPGVTAADSTVVSSCAAASTGKIFIKRVVGAAPFSYSKDSGVTYQLADSFLNLAPAVYHIRVKDNVGCYYDFNSTVGIGAGFIATDSTVKSACAAVATGKIFIRSKSLYPPFSYSKDSGVTFQSADSFLNLAPGTYHIRVKDAIGCTYDFNSVVAAAAGVNASFSSVNSACLGVSTGEITVTPTAGLAPFNYSKDGFVTSQNSNIFKNLASGNYTISLKDAVGCSFNSTPQSVGNNIGVTASFTVVKSACAGAATGAIIVKPNSGTAVFRYSLDAGVTYQYDSVFRNLAANTYAVMIRDTLGCVLNSPVQNLGNNPGVVTNPSTIQNASCASVPNGSIAVNVTAGIAPITYTLSSVPGSLPQAGNSFGSLFSGSYDVTIVDSAGCTKTITAVVGNNPKVKIDSLNIARPTCNGLSDGVINVYASLGVAPYQFAVDAGGYGNSKTLTRIAAGPHILHIRDANNCQIDSAIIVTEPAVLRNSLVSTVKATCSGTPDGQIVVSASGGTLPYQYSRDLNGLVGYQSSDTFPVIAGRYSITVEDAKGCKASVNAVVDSVFTMFLDLGNDTTICAEQKIVLSPNTNPGTTIFNYTPQTSLDKPNVKNPVATPADTTRYRLTATWGICTLSDSILVRVLHKPLPYAGPDVVICYDSIAVLHASASNLSGTVNYLWSPASLLDGRADTTVVTARPDTFKTYYSVTVTDNYGCNFAVTDSVLVDMLPKIHVNAGTDTNAVLNAPHQLNASGAGIGGRYDWTYPAGVSLSQNGIANPMAIFSPVPGQGTYAHPDTNYYVLSVIATDQAGCVDTGSVRIHVFIGPTFYVPNAFSPNGDGYNDIFKPILVGMYSTDYFIIYNRYGQVVFETSRFMHGWDGRFKGQDQPAGNYVWILKGKGQGGKVVERKGSVLLVR